MIKAKLYKNKKGQKGETVNKGITLNLSGDLDEIKIDDKETLLVWIEKEGRKLIMIPTDDINHDN
jgi:hypothetical protein